MIKIKKFTILILVLLFCFGLCVNANAATIYIDPTCSTPGDGSSQICSGTSAPKQTWASVTWTEGNTYLQKGGTVAKEAVTIGATGTDENIITLGSYGSGKGIIQPTTSLTSWTQVGTSDVYYTTLATDPVSVFIDDVYVQPAHWPTSVGATTPAFQYPSVNSVDATHLTDSDLHGRADTDLIGANVVIYSAGYKYRSSEISAWDNATNILTMTSTTEIPTTTMRYWLIAKSKSGISYESKAWMMTEGTWFHDADAQRLYVWKEGGGNPGTVEASNSNYGIYAINRSYITLDGLVVRYVRLPYINSAVDVDAWKYVGIYFYATSNKSNIVIQNCEVNYSGNTAIGLRGSGGVIAASSVNNNNLDHSGNGILTDQVDCDVIDNIVTNTGGIYPCLPNKGYAISVVSLSTVKNTVSGNNVTNASNMGINVLKYNVDILNNNVSNTGLFLTDSGGIYTWGSTSATLISGNVLNNTAQGIYFDSGTDGGLVTGNTVTGGLLGMLLHQASNTTIAKNKFIGPFTYPSNGYDSGILISNPSGGTGGNLIVNNLFDTRGSSGIYAISDVGTNTNIYNNTFVGAKYGVIGPNTTNVFGNIKNNIFYNNTSYLRLYSGSFSGINNNLYGGTGNWVYGASVNSTFENWKTASSQDVYSINADPLFVSSSDFNLQNISPAVDAGINVGLSEDHGNGPIPSGDLPDIGAYEYQQSAGTWSAWSSWSVCSATCGGGTQLRTRTCSKTAYQLDCVGNSQETQNCNTQSCGGGSSSSLVSVNGVWTDWSVWSTCSVTCGTGKQVRTRTCTNPAPQNGGQNCIGDSREEKSCNTQSCSNVVENKNNLDENSNNSGQDNQDRGLGEEGDRIKVRAKQLFDNQFAGIFTEIKEARDTVREADVKVKYLDKLISDVKNLTKSTQEAIINFITYGVDDNTEKLGAGERAAVIYSYKQAFKKLPETEAELEDALRIANGRWPNKKDEQAEKKSKEQFRKIYKRIANLEEKYDEAVITVMAYGLRQRAELRNLSSEKQGIQTFINIYGYHPASTEDWNIMQAITYSGATRKLDKDKDFLTDEREDEIGTDPNNSDTDGDGFSDGIEVENGFSPLKN